MMTHLDQKLTINLQSVIYSVSIFTVDLAPVGIFVKSIINHSFVWNGSACVFNRNMFVCTQAHSQYIHTQAWHTCAEKTHLETKTTVTFWSGANGKLHVFGHIFCELYSMWLSFVIL